MLKIYNRAASDLNLKAMNRSGYSLGRNVTTASLPVAVALFGGIYWKWRSVLAASLVAVGSFTASALSNVRFFREAKRRERLKTDLNAVEAWKFRRHVSLTPASVETALFSDSLDVKNLFKHSRSIVWSGHTPVARSNMVFRQARSECFHPRRTR